MLSGLAIDQAHKQANAVVKGDGGANGVTKDPSALRRWMVSGPESSWSVNQYELPFQVKRAIKDTMPKMTDMLGWVKKVDVRQALWKSHPPIATCRSCEHLTKCGCKAECQSQCKSYKFTLNVHSCVPANVLNILETRQYISTKVCSVEFSGIVILLFKIMAAILKMLVIYKFQNKFYFSLILF